MRIGWIGTGVMGYSMAQHLLKAGHELTVYNRTRAKAEGLLQQGAHWAESAGACAEGQDAVFTMVGFPKDVEEVYFGCQGILTHAAKGTPVIDMTTTDPDLAVRIAKEGEPLGLRVLDAPVSGGDSGARAGTLSIMVGGKAEDYEAAKPLFVLMGKNMVLQGPAGSGQHAKMCNQIALAGALAGVCEALAYAKAHGLDGQTLLDSISAGAAGSWQMSNNGSKILAGNDDPGFYVKHYIKDLGLACGQAKAAGQELPVTEKVLDAYRELSGRGMDELGTQSLIHWYEK